METPSASFSETEHAAVSQVLDVLHGLPYKSRVKVIRWCAEDLRDHSEWLDGSGEYATPEFMHLVDYGCWPGSY